MPDTNASWPKHLDALIASPDHHKLTLENETVRVLETCIQPGEITAIHTHEWSAAYYVLSWDHCIRRDDHGVVMMDSRENLNLPQLGQVVWTGPLGPHTLENIGSKPIHIISVEVKNPVQ